MSNVGRKKHDQASNQPVSTPRQSKRLADKNAPSRKKDKTQSFSASLAAAARAAGGTTSAKNLRTPLKQRTADDVEKRPASNLRAQEVEEDYDSGITGGKGRQDQEIYLKFRRGSSSRSSQPTSDQSEDASNDQSVSQDRGNYNNAANIERPSSEDDAHVPEMELEQFEGNIEPDFQQAEQEGRAEAEARIAELTASLDEKTGQLEQKEAELTAAYEALEQMRKSGALNEAKFREAENNIHTLEQEVTQANEAKEAELHRLSEQLEKALAESRTAGSELNTTKDHLIAAEEKRRIAEQRLEQSLDQGIEGLTALSNATAKIQDLTRKKTKAEDQIETLKTQHKENNHLNEQEKVKLKYFILQLTKELEEISNELEMTKEKAQELTDQLVTSEAKRKETKATLKQQNMEADTQIQHLTEQVQEKTELLDHEKALLELETRKIARKAQQKILELEKNKNKELTEQDEIIYGTGFDHGYEDAENELKAETERQIRTARTKAAKRTREEDQTEIDRATKKQKTIATGAGATAGAAAGALVAGPLVQDAIAYLSPNASSFTFNMMAAAPWLMGVFGATVLGFSARRLFQYSVKDLTHNNG